jgi:hypothetical protein
VIPRQYQIFQMVSGSPQKARAHRAGRNIVQVRPFFDGPLRERRFSVVSFLGQGPRIGWKMRRPIDRNAGFVPL